MSRDTRARYPKARCPEVARSPWWRIRRRRRLEAALDVLAGEMRKFMFCPEGNDVWLRIDK